MFYRVQGSGSRAVPVAELEDVLLSVNDADAPVDVHLRNIPSVEPAVLADTAVSPFSHAQCPQCGAPAVLPDSNSGSQIAKHLL